MRFILNIHNFSKCSKIVQSSKTKFRRFAAIMPISQKLFEKSPSRRISSSQQDIKLDQFFQQNTNGGKAILQNSSLDAPNLCFFSLSDLDLFSTFLFRILLAYSDSATCLKNLPFSNDDVPSTLPLSTSTLSLTVLISFRILS